MTNGQEASTIPPIALSVFRFPRVVGEVLQEFVGNRWTGNLTLQFRDGEILGCTTERKVIVKAN